MCAGFAGVAVTPPRAPPATAGPPVPAAGPPAIFPPPPPQVENYTVRVWGAFNGTLPNVVSLAAGRSHLLVVDGAGMLLYLSLFGISCTFT
jgi:hypothetical protein